MKTLILISGKAGSGKDTFARFLPDYKLYSFAGKVKEIAFKMGWNGYKDARGRKFLQDIGTLAREYDEAVWVKKLCNILANNGNYPEKVAITDCRYPNEIEHMEKWAKHNGYTIATVRMERKNECNLTDEAKTHSSETALDDYTFQHVIINNVSLEELEQYAKSIAEKVEGGKSLHEQFSRACKHSG